MAGNVVYSAAGQVVGEVRDGVLRKAVRKSIHFLHTPPAIAWDRCVLEEAERLGATRTEVVDLESGTVYSAPLSAFFRYGIRVNRGYGEQLALPLSRWACRREGGPRQLALFEPA